MKSFTPVVSNNIKNYKNAQISFLSKEVTVSLAQEFDLSYKSLVSPGDIVKEGEIIAKAGDSLIDTTYIHSPVPGKVLEIIPCYSPNGRQSFGIKIKTGGAFSYLGKKLSDRSKDFVNNSNFTQKLIDKGVINTFKTSKPVNLGLQIKNNPKAKNLIVRLFDDDPYRITDSLMAKFYIQEIIQGAEVLSKAMNASGIVFAIDQKYDNPDVFKDINIPNFRVLTMNIKRYPCGTPREIVSAFFRSGLKKDSNFEITKNDLFVDASTIYEVYKALCFEIPSISKHVHFSGNCLYASCLLDVKIGTPIRDIINQLGGLSHNPAMIIINGNMLGTSVQSLDVPITKYVKSVDIISNYKMTDNQVYSCVNCGNCRFACPVKLSPDILYNNTVNFKFMPENFAASSIACIECGLCNTVCPSRLPLSQTVSLLKDKYLSTE